MNQPLKKNSSLAAALGMTKRLENRSKEFVLHNSGLTPASEDVRKIIPNIPWHKIQALI